MCIYTSYIQPSTDRHSCILRLLRKGVDTVFYKENEYLHIRV